MAIEAVATSFSGVGGGAGAKADVSVDASAFDRAVAGQKEADQAPTAPPAREATLESRTARAEGAQDASARRAPPTEVLAGPHRAGPSMGDSVLDGMNRLQKGDSAWRTGDPGKGHATGEPVLKVAARQPGPAAAPVAADTSRGPSIAGQSEAQPGKGNNPEFDAMLHQLEQVSGQVVQVSVVSKTTGSFTGSLNKLLSSG